MNGSRLRCLALTVIEERPGGFGWILLEGAPSSENVVATGEQLFGSFSEAVRAGAAALMAMAEGSPYGPRIASDQSRAAHSSKVVEEQDL